jgi:protein-tyrosine phosphatase
MPHRLIKLEGCRNFRDLGGYKRADGRETRFGKLYRADDLSKLTENDLMTLKELGINIAIDLRQSREVYAKPYPILLAEDDFFSYYNVPLNDGLNAVDFQGPSPPDLPTLYKSLLKDSSWLIKKVFEILLANPNGKAVFHCTVGKDRTGVIAALILSLSGVSEEDIVADYSCTYSYMQPHFEKMVENYKKINVDIQPQVLLSEPAFMQELLDYLQQEFQETENYFSYLGFDEREIQALKNIL